ncbi:glycoside hydrolase family 1 protein [Photobacterium sp. DNB23_23_1]
MTIKKVFPKGFWWGSATSGPQSEGAALQDGRSESIWDLWYREQPDRFHNELGPEDTSTFYDNYKNDIQLMQELKHNSFRTSIQWSRLIPDGDGEVNPKAVEFYGSVIDELLEKGIEPFINLYHFDMPVCMQEKGGWENRYVVNAYARFAEICFDLFGDRVTKWFTFNEPIVPVKQGYLYSNHYPLVVDFKRAATVAHHTILAHSLAVKAFRSKQRSGEIGIILNLTPAYPRSDNEADREAATIADAFFNRAFLDPVVKGEYPADLVSLLESHDQLPNCMPGDLELISQGKVDLLGVNYYEPRRVKAKEHIVNPNSPFMPEWFFDSYLMPGRKMNKHRGWEIYEKGIYDILINLKENYGNIPCFISENGMGVEGEDRFLKDGVIEDDYRIEFIKGHLDYVHAAIQSGSNCKGYHLWTFIDCWSWINSYKNRYGFISLDVETQERTIKRSGRWISEVTEKNGY